MYKIIRSILFLFPAESVHHFTMKALQLFCKISTFRKVIYNSFSPKDKNTIINFCGLNFPNELGMAAGFDKNARYINELAAFGFGFVEIGTVTPLAQIGNPKPRLFRLPSDKALINRMGFNNDGVEKIVENLKQYYNDKDSNYPIIIGGNIGKNKDTPNEFAYKDYEICFNELHPYVDYFVVNVSSPNTAGLRELQEKDALYKILSGLQALNINKKVQRPILLKIAPDLSLNEIDDIVSLVLEIKLDGLIVSNTTTSRNNLSPNSISAIKNIGNGGLSGKPLKNANTDLIKYICQSSDGKIPVIASGGIFNAADAKEKLKAGAALVQVWTGFIYEGPSIVKKIVDGRG